MNMGEYGGKLQRIGLANLDALADIENKRAWTALEQNNEQTEAKNAAVGNMLGTIGGLGMAVMQGKEKDWNPMENPPGGERSTAKASAASVSPDKVLGSGSVIAAAKEPAPMAPGSGLGAVEIRRSLDEASMPDILKDRTIVTMKSPRRRQLSSVYADTSDDFKLAFDDLLNNMPTNYIGAAL